MNNYKIKVNNEAESREAQELFFELGYEWNGSGKEVIKRRIGLIFTKEFHGKDIICHSCKGDEDIWSDYEGKEINLPQLRDMVVLHRNDVKDATHENSYIQGLYKGDSWYVFHDDKWNYIGKELGYKPIELNQDKPKQSLISGADAKLAWARGEDVQISHSHPTLKKEWHDLYGTLMLSAFDSDMYEFRLKPRTIKLEIEIPVCGTNYKHGQLIWILNSLEPKEYCSIILDESDELPAYWWQSEEEIKQVVAALRGGIKG